MNRLLHILTLVVCLCSPVFGQRLDIHEVDIDRVANVVTVFARAFDEETGEQYGFGPHGQFDIERFIFYRGRANPIGEFTYADLYASLREVVRIVARPGDRIVPGSIGTTTSTFFPDADPESTTVDGYAVRTGVDETFATIRAGAGNFNSDSPAVRQIGGLTSSSTTNQYSLLYRGIYGFDTSAIPDTDDISSATLSFFGFAKQTGYTPCSNYGIMIDRRVPATATDIANSDYNVGGWDGVEQASNRITLASFSTSAYNDFTLNATGIGNISKTGVSWFGGRLTCDFDNGVTGWSSGATANAEVYNADQTGTANDPKLVVVHGLNGATVFRILTGAEQ